MEKIQDFKTHVRWHPPYHFVLAFIMLINLIYAVVRLVQDPGWDRGEFVFLSVGLVILTLLARTYPLKAQDRIIRLEERLRLATILGPEAAPKAMNLKPSQYIALRFASDEELPGLVSKIEAGELTSQDEIKKAITNWRADHFRI